MTLKEFRLFYHGRDNTWVTGFPSPFLMNFLGLKFAETCEDEMNWVKACKTPASTQQVHQMWNTLQKAAFFPISWPFKFSNSCCSVWENFHSWVGWKYRIKSCSLPTATSPHPSPPPLLQPHTHTHTHTHTQRHIAVFCTVSSPNYQIIPWSKAIWSHPVPLSLW